MSTLKNLDPINSFCYLWKVDDKYWLDNRKKEWKFLVNHGFSHFSTTENKKYKTYFLYGKKEPGCYISPIIFLFMTPLHTDEQLKEFFHSKVFSYEDRGELYSHYAASASTYGEGMEWQRDKVKFFVKNILTKKYRKIEELVEKKSFIVSPNPSFWCSLFCAKARQVMNEEIECHACVDTIDYFVSALPYATDEFHRKRIKVDSILQLSKEILSRDNVSPVAIEMAKKLADKKKEILHAWATIHT
jgi:hypothetical protein